MIPSPDLLAQMLANMKTTDGVFAVSGDQRIVHWGPTAERLLGRSAEEVLHRHCQDIIGGRDIRNMRFCRRSCPIMRNARKGRPTRDYDILVHTADGSPVWLNMTILVVQDPERHVPTVLHLFRNVTHHRRLEEQARRALDTMQAAVAEEGAPPVGRQPSPAAGPPELTRRELEVLRLLVMGLSTKQIADSLGISPITARNHLTNLQLKFGVRTRLQAVLYASQHHLL